MKALSIRQPWAWLIVHGPKRIENRTWNTNYRGPVLIHAAKGMTQKEYEACRRYAADRGVTLPKAEKLLRGGIIGRAEVIGCTTFHGSPWFFGPFGHVLANVKPLPFKPLTGRLGYFSTLIKKN